MKNAIIASCLIIVALARPAAATELCGPSDSLSVLGGEYRINNNVWGGASSQCLTVNPNSTYFSVISSSHNNPSNGSPASYPFILRGRHFGGANTQNSGMPIRISDIATAPFTWSVDTNNAGGAWNVAYESWFSETGGGYPTAELMLWFDFQGCNPGGSQVRTLYIGGRMWYIYHASPWSNWDHYIVYRAAVIPTDPNIYVNLDLKDFIDYAVSQGWLQSSWYLDNMEAGFEIWRDGKGLTSNSFSASINAPLIKTTIYVDADAVGVGDGSSWENAFKYLRDALAAADSAARPAEIHVAEGLYTPDSSSAEPNGNGDRQATFQLINSVILKGGYAGYGTANPDERDPKTYKTILSGDLNGDDGPDFANNGENSYNIVTGSNTNDTAVLDGFTVTAGNADGGGTADFGGGMRNENSSPTVKSCIFIGNSAKYGGGMANLNNGNPIITNCIFTGNSANSAGGGIHNESSNPALTNCTFTGNSADTGGGMNNENSSPTVTNCVFWADIPSEIYGDTPTVTYSDVQGGWPGTGNMNADPLFAAPDSNDFHLLPDSPCIDAGNNTAVSAGTTDFDGNPRIRGIAVDMGVYESPCVLFVDVDAIGANNGSSWEDAYNHLRDALSAGWQVDEVRVAEGVYKPDENTAHPDGSGNRAATFQLKNGMVIKGGYAGYGKPDPDARDIETYKTILSGDLSDNDGPGFANNAENSYHVITSSEIGPTAVLDGFTIKAGNANSSTGDNGYGSGMFNYNSSPTLTNCTFSNNWATYYGAGIFNYNSSPTLTKCTFSYNGATYYGGAILNLQSSPGIINCRFTGNYALYYGGGIFNYENANPVVINCTFSGNTAQYLGGGVYNYNSSPTLTNCILWNNTAPAGPQIYNDGTSSPAVGYSDVQGGWPGTGNINADPCFVAPDSNDFHLATDSSCINAGDPNYVPKPNETDLDGKPRVIGGRIDMGVYEFNHRPIANAGPNQVAYAWIDGIAEVTLDGSGSYDTDDDKLTYLWTWSIDGNTHNTNGVDPTIELPVGEHRIELVVNDGREDSEPNQVLITIVEPIEGTLWVTPRIINGRRGHQRIMAMLRLPAGITKNQIDSRKKLLLYPGEIEASYQIITRYYEHRTERVIIIASFDGSALLDAVGSPGLVQLDMVGRLKTGRYFCGSDTVRIINPPPRPMGNWWNWHHNWNQRTCALHKQDK